MRGGQACLILSAVHGEFNTNCPSIPASMRAASTADLIAQNTDTANERGGSPTAYKTYHIISDTKYIISDTKYGSHNDLKPTSHC